MQTSLKRCGLKFSLRLDMSAKFPKGGAGPFLARSLYQPLFTILSKCLVRCIVTSFVARLISSFFYGISVSNYRIHEYFSIKKCLCSQMRDCSAFSLFPFTGNTRILS